MAARKAMSTTKSSSRFITVKKVIYITKKSAMATVKVNLAEKRRMQATVATVKKGPKMETTVL